MRYTIALGSNLGDRLENLRLAREALRKLGSEETFSSIYQTEPVDCPGDCDCFYNSTGIVNSTETPPHFLAALQTIEQEMGRTALASREKNAARPIDLDILFVDDLQIKTTDLTVPHPRWSERHFVLVPLAEICGDEVKTGQTNSIDDILANLPPDAEPAPTLVCHPEDWQPDTISMTPDNLANWRQRKNADDTPLLSLTAYDYPTARILDEAGVDLILVGDSLGMVFAGLPDTTGVTIDHMVYHTEVVRRGVKQALLASDLPYRSYDDIESTLANARRLIEAGADLVKLEGGTGQNEKLAALTEAGISTIGHLGMLPQRVVEEGGYKKKGKTDKDIESLLQGARDIEEAGVSAIVLESVVASVADQITAAVSVPTIGIGSGKNCDGQIRVINDLVGSYPWFVPPFATTYANYAEDLRHAVSEFRKEIGVA